VEHPLYDKECLIFGCGNPLFGDDGFGPAVIELLEDKRCTPQNVTVLDVGTSVRDILFDILLSATRPQRIVIVDAVRMPGREPGDIFEIAVEEISPAKISDFSLHQFPTTNMLKEIKEHTGIDVRVFVVQTTDLPSEVRPGLSEPVQQAVPRMVDKLIRLMTQPAPAIQQGSMP
jgi:coenzyme F420 hydrogenase subunit delta